MSPTYAKLTTALALLVSASLLLAACSPAATQSPYILAATQAPAAEPWMIAPADSSAGIPTMQPPNGQAYDYTFFEDYGVNPFIDTEDDIYSTFAIDVDTGAYTIMRSYINDGSLPPSDSVRVEEYVNYFEQGYPNPPEGQAFGISIDGAPSPFTETERYQMMRVGIQGYAVPEDERKDASLTFVIDVSGSMDMDNRLGLVKQSLEILVERLRPTDRVSIVVYGTNARVVLNPTAGNKTSKILNAIYSLHPEGVTNAEAGIRLGYEMALEAFNEDGINRVILCSDGVANMGDTSAGGIWSEVEDYASRGITLTTIGFGMDNYNDILMEQLADNGDGFYAYVDTLAEARSLFVDNLTSTLQTIAMDAKVQVVFNPEVVSRYRLVGFENRAIADDEFRDDTVDAGEIGAGHSVTALYEIKLFEDASGEIATVYMRWENPESGNVLELSQSFSSDEMAAEFHDADPYFQRAVLVAEFAEILKESYWAQTSSLDSVLEEAQRLEDYLYADPDMSEFVDLVEDAARLKH